MKTITLEEALKQVVLAPLNVELDGSTKLICGRGGQYKVGHVFEGVGSKATAALLAHCYNHLPDLVSRLEALQKWAEIHGGFESPCWTELPELLHRAKNVNLPD